MSNCILTKYTAPNSETNKKKKKKNKEGKKWELATSSLCACLPGDDVTVPFCGS